MLTAPRNARVLVTLAPEVGPPGFIARLVRLASHVARSFDRFLPADPCRHGGGLRGFTHLFNAMRPWPREPEAIAQALESTEAWYRLIVDGGPSNPRCSALRYVASAALCS